MNKDVEKIITLAALLSKSHRNNAVVNIIGKQVWVINGDATLAIKFSGNEELGEGYFGATQYPMEDNMTITTENNNTYFNYPKNGTVQTVKVNIKSNYSEQLEKIFNKYQTDKQIILKSNIVKELRNYLFTVVTVKDGEIFLHQKDSSGEQEIEIKSSGVKRSIFDYGEKKDLVLDGEVTMFTDLLVTMFTITDIINIAPIKNFPIYGTIPMSNGKCEIILANSIYEEIEGLTKNISQESEGEKAREGAEK